MEDRYLSRGKTIEGVRPHFVIGHYVSVPRPMIVSDKPKIGGGWDFDDVDPATVGQCIGRSDKSGKPIFADDICKSIDGKFLVAWDDNKCAFVMHFYDYPNETLYMEEMWDDSEIIGNLHDNPELLKTDAETEAALNKKP